MANIDLIRRMHSTLDAYERGEISSIEIEQVIPSFVDGLEGLPYEKVKEADAMCARLVTAREPGDGMEEFDVELATAVLRDFRSFIDSLPTNT